MYLELDFRIKRTIRFPTDDKFGIRHAPGLVTWTDEIEVLYSRVFPLLSLPKRKLACPRKTRQKAHVRMTGLAIALTDEWVHWMKTRELPREAAGGSVLRGISKTETYGRAVMDGILNTCNEIFGPSCRTSQNLSCRIVRERTFWYLICHLVGLSLAHGPPSLPAHRE